MARRQDELAGPDGSRRTMDRTSRLMRKIARAEAKVARGVAEATSERIGYVERALDTLGEMSSGRLTVVDDDGNEKQVAVDPRDRRLASADLLNHARAVGNGHTDKGPTVNVDARSQQFNIQATIERARGIAEGRRQGPSNDG